MGITTKDLAQLCRGVENDGTQGTLRGWTHSSGYKGDDPAGGKRA